MENNMFGDYQVFKEYYKDSFIPEKGSDPPKAGDSTMADALSIRKSINVFIGKTNEIIGNTFDEQKKRGTKTNLIVTLIVGGLAFTMANVYYLLVKNIKADISKEDYKLTFLKMYESALANIGKSEE